MFQDPKSTHKKQLHFGYSNNELSEKEIRENNSTYNSTKNNKILRNNFKEVKYLYTDKYKMK